MIYQKDGATPHCFSASLKYLHRYFPEDRLISHHTNHSWPAHSSDLSVLENILLGHLKYNVYANNPRTIDALKNNIRTEIRGEFHMRCSTESLQTLARVIQRLRASIEHIINYRVVLAEWLCTRKKLTPHKTYMSVRQTYEKKLLSCSFNARYYFIKNVCTFPFFYQNGYIFEDLFWRSPIWIFHKRLAWIRYWSALLCFEPVCFCFWTEILFRLTYLGFSIRAGQLKTTLVPSRRYWLPLKWK